MDISRITTSIHFGLMDLIESKNGFFCKDKFNLNPDERFKKTEQIEEYVNEIKKEYQQLERKKHNLKKFFNWDEENYKFYSNPDEDLIADIYNYTPKQYVKNRFKAKYPDEDYDKALNRLYDFFVTVSYAKDGEIIEMTDEVTDEIWHLMLLDTEEYMFMCKRYFNKFIKHIPYDSNKSMSEDEVKEIARKTIDSVKKYNKSRGKGFDARDVHFRYKSTTNQDDNTLMNIMILSMLLSDDSSASSTADTTNSNNSSVSSNSSYNSNPYFDSYESSSIDSSTSTSKSTSSCGSAGSFSSCGSSSSSSSSCGGSSSSCGGGCGGA